MAAGNAIASGAAVITANADQLVSGLNKAKAKAEGTFKGFGKNLGLDFAQEIGRRGFAGGVLGGFAGGGIAGGLSELIANSTSEFVKWVRSSDDIAAAVKKANEELAASSKLMQDNAKRAEEWRSAMTSPVDVAASIKDQMEAAAKRMEELKATLGPRSLKDGDLRDIVGSAVDWRKRRKIIDPEATRAEIKRLGEEWDELGEKFKRTLRPDLDPAFVGQVNKATKALDDQILTWGLTGAAAQRAMFVAGGATDDLLKKFDAAAKELKRLDEFGKNPPAWLMPALTMAGTIADRMKAQDNPMFSMIFGAMEGVLPTATKLNEDFESLAEHLRDSARFAGRTADEIAVIKLEERGLSEERSKQLRAMLPQQVPPWMGSALMMATQIADALSGISDRGVQFAGAFDKGSAEAYSLEMKSAYGDDGRDMKGKDQTAEELKKAKRVHDEALEQLKEIKKAMGDWQVI